MNPERWQQVQKIFQAAIETHPDKRAAYLTSSCAGDEELRQEVESLLSSDAQGLSFIDGPALQVAASLLASDQPHLTEGQRIGHYEIAGLIGRGGMGEVYLAKDKRLNRRIALKVLPSDSTRDRNRLRRFQQEAQAASALNHPNILTIHEVGQVEGQHFIVTEFVDGETLRERLRRSQLDVRQTVDIAIQVAGALSAAHQAGIVHRDIKPENIMLRPDGYVKVLDFGVAKLTEHDEQTHHAPTAGNIDLSSGLVMGTLKYMSPEQARGEQVDLRSDIFSIGVVVYEMATGHSPFKGEAANDLIKSILNDEPPGLREYLPDVPDRFQHVIIKALRKNKDERYQTIGQMLSDLKGLKDILELEFKVHRTGEPGQQSDALGGTDLQLRRSADATNHSSPEYVLGRIEQHKRAATLMLAALAITVVGISLALFKSSKFKGAHLHFQNISTTKLTNFGDAFAPAISPDGKYFVYGREAYGGTSSLWLRTVGTTSEIQILPPTEGQPDDATFLPDGKHILAHFDDGFYLVPTFGGEATKLPIRRATSVSFSPEGKRLAYLYDNGSEGKTSIVIANADGTNEHDITTRQAPNYFWDVKPAWSPDGKQVACIGQNGNESFPRVFDVNVESGEEKPITFQRWSNVTGLAWLNDMSGLLLSAADETSSILQIWRISYPNGEASRITNDMVNYFGLDLSANGKSLVTSKKEITDSIWVMPVLSSQLTAPKSKTLSVSYGNAKQINFNFISFGGHQLNWTPDSRIVYVSEESGNQDIWSMKVDGTDRKQLTTDPHWDHAPAVSPDGRYIAFVSSRGDPEGIWLMDIDGGNQRRLTNKLIERGPVFSADSKWVYSVAWETGKATIWKRPVEGGKPKQITDNLSVGPQISPDGRLLLYVDSKNVFVVPSNGGQPIKTFVAEGWSYQWAPDGRGLTFLLYRDDTTNLWEQPLDGGESRQLTNFTSEGIKSYAWSLDGRQLAVARGTYTMDVVLISDLR